MIYGQNTANASANYYINNGAKINLKAGQNFSTQKGIEGIVNYQVITALGAEGSTTATDLQGISSNLRGNYVLGADIEAIATSGWNSGAGFNPIGRITDSNGALFSGKFDGLGHTVSNLIINRPTNTFTGLFAVNGNSGSIQNIGLVSNQIDGLSTVGSLVGQNLGTINNSYATGIVSGKGFDRVGGLVGQNDGTINNSYSLGSVSAKNNVGGLVGQNLGTINNSYTSSSVSGEVNVGGLVGSNFGTIKNAYATGRVSGISSVGGLVGGNNKDVDNVYATGQVTGTSRVGGLIGYHSYGTVKNAYWNTETTGQNNSWNGGNGINCNTVNYCGLSTTQMFQQANMAGLDFNNVWDNANNQTTPFLKNHMGLNSVLNKNDSTNTAYQVIQNLQQLQNINTQLNGNYVLGNNLDASETQNWNNGAGFNPIGTNTNNFTGKFDGLNHVINDLNINRPAADFVGLFGYINGTTIQNIGLLDARITGRSAVGALIGSLQSTTVKNVYSTGQVQGNGYNVGGLIGQALSGTVLSQAYSTADVTGVSQIGGLIGGSVGGPTGNKIDYTYAIGNVTGKNNDKVGGLVGVMLNSDISRSYATGKVNNAGGTIGNLIGLRNVGTVSDSYYDQAINPGLNAVGTSLGTGTVSATDMTATNRYSRNGYTNLGTWSLLSGTNNVYVAKDATGNNQWVMIEGQTRPFLWSEYSSNINNTHQLQLMAVDVSKNYTLNNQIDAIATNGLNPSDMWSGEGFSPIGRISNFNATNFTGKFDGLGHTVSNLFINRPSNSYTGLFAISSSFASIQNIGLVNTQILGRNSVGGLVGYSAATINNSYVTGQVNGTSTIIGGLVGHNEGTIRDSYVSSGVSGINTVGGLVGWNSLGTIQNSYVTGNVSGTNYIGGLVGQNDGIINNSYATGNVSGTTNLGGLVSLQSSTGNSSTTNSYWDIETTGQSNSAGGIGLTTAQMKDGASFAFIEADSYQGGKNTVWRMYQGDAAPLLRSFLTQATVNLIDKTTTYNGQNQALDLTGINGLDNTKVFSSGGSTGRNAGTYTGGYYSNQQGYDLIGNTATLTINKATLNLNAVTDSRTYDGTDLSNAKVTNSGLQGTDSVTARQVFDEKNASNRTLNVTDVMVNDGNNGNNYNVITKTATGTINKAKATVTANSLSTTYNGQNQTASGFSATGLVNGETESVLSGVTASVTAKDAGSYANKANGVDKNYDLTFVDGALDIAKAKATVTANSLNTTYNGQNQTAAGFSATGLVNGETESVLSGVSATVSAKDAGSYANKVNGVDKNYDLTFVDGALDIAKAKATVTANSLSTTYNGQNQTANGFSATGLVNGEDSSVLTGVTASVTAKDAGSYANKAKGVDKNYDLTFVDGALDIAKAKATVTANSLNSTYNGKDQTASGFIATGLVNGETTTVLSGVSATVTAKDAGSYANKASGIDKNYDLTFVDGALDIAKAKATVTANSLNTTYNGQNQTATGFSATGLVNGETESVLSGVTATVTAKDAGRYANKASGVDKNYDLTFVDGALDIAKAKATVTANSLSTTYNGQNQTASGFSATGLVNGETESVLSGVSATVTAKDAGRYANKANGVDRNYDLTFVDGALDIAKAKINQVTGITANNRVYDASTEATLNTTAALFTGQIAGDELQVASATGLFSDKNVGIAKQVSIQGIRLSGADAHNYELVNDTAQTTADIRQANIQNITGITANNRTYNGLTTAELDLTNAQFKGIYAGDNLNVATATGQFNNASTGQAKNVSITGLSLGGLDAQNYKLVDTTAMTTADIYMLTPTAYLQAIQFKRPRYLPETNNALNTVDLDVRQGGVNTAGIQILAGEH
ncbi:MAG: Immunoglobulin A1 protease [Acinetobacter bereziniae]|uniref:Immunoglobulin A1 protease n=1 Tax=Acinetobacter bereziniae TaxID=106648 RepID=A0A833TXX6_ACIBZ|nr:MAG: Immunoglobulin A1 protease [Acinetobacter bereziniae]